ncbi:hypothetical protein L2755_13420 [Shewanella abyssi]|uniref:hypothetical protein n=1 Tax=Shewanella abyssi TaxID=311789 RepID=UPI00200D8F9D|nr:hypothetical protein [Shewanella abyssi]MCL1050621.1 hypothetical protein [Shewanella abyssi]
MFSNFKDKLGGGCVGAVLGLVLSYFVATQFPDYFAQTVIEREEERSKAQVERIKKECEITNNKIRQELSNLAAERKSIRNYFSKTYEQIRELLSEVNKYASQTSPGKQDEKRLNGKVLSLMLQMADGRTSFKSLSNSLNSDATKLLNELQSGNLTVFELKARLEAIADNEKINLSKVDHILLNSDFK